MLYIIALNIGLPMHRNNNKIISLLDFSEQICHQQWLFLETCIIYGNYNNSQENEVSVAAVRYFYWFAQEGVVTMK